MKKKIILLWPFQNLAIFTITVILYLFILQIYHSLVELVCTAFYLEYNITLTVTPSSQCDSNFSFYFV